MRGVLGINGRNIRYMYPNNPRRHFVLVDDKLETKALLEKSGIAVPQTYAVFSEPSDLAGADKVLSKLERFVMKPTGGSGGEGILVLEKSGPDLWRTPGGAYYDLETLRVHLSHILFGVFALEHLMDRAYLEYRVEPHPVFAEWGAVGIPDIRVIVYRGRPAMAMMRLPTVESGGKANLHQGALGVGIDLTTGRTVRAIQGTETIAAHPDTGRSLVDLPMPAWERIPDLAARAAACVPLGYVGVDIVVDRALGPLVLEINARPGLQIQLANGQGLEPILRRIDNELAN